MPSPTMREILLSGGISTGVPQVQVSPILSPGSSIGDQNPQEVPSSVPQSPTRLEILEEMQIKIIHIQTGHEEKHKQVVDLLDSLLIGQTSDRMTGEDNTANIQALTRGHDFLAAEVAKAQSVSHKAKILS
jgi:hypothetical protein